MKRTKFVELGDMYLNDGKLEEAYKYYLEAAINEKDLLAMEKLGRMYLDGAYPNLDYKKAFHYFTLAYDNGKEADYLVGVIMEYIEKIYSDDEGKAEYKKYLEHIYDEGVSYKCIWIASEYLSGEVLEQDVNKAIKLYETAGEEGEPFGYDCIGEMYFLGEHVERDYEKAYEYFAINFYYNLYD